MNELTLKDAIQELEELSTGNWVPYEYSPEEAKLILNHINNLQSKIDKAIEYIENNLEVNEHDDYVIYLGKNENKLSDILKEEQSKETKELFEGTMDQLNDLSIFKEDK